MKTEKRTPACDKCPSCGVAYIDHLGMTDTCRKLQESQKELADLRADKARLDWLEKHGATPICSRAAIDAAMKSP